MTERPVQVDLTVTDGDVQTITLTSRIEKQKGPAQWDIFEQAKMLVTGLGQMLGIKLPENREYPGQPGEKAKAEFSADGVKVPIPAHATHLVIGTDGSIRLVDGGDTLWNSPPADALGASVSAGVAVSRLRELVATEGRGPMVSGEEILAILNGDAADDEPMAADEIDRRGMYAPPYDTIESRHAFSTMLANSRCTKCKMKRSDVYGPAGGRICKG